MRLSPYAALLSTPGFAGLFTGSLLARLPLVGVAIPMTFRVEEAAGGLAWAGVVVGTYTAGTAITAPLWARRVNGRGGRLIAVLTGLWWSIGVAAIGVLPDAHAPLLPLVSGLTGLGTPPITAMARASWPRMLPGGPLRTAYTLDATATDLLFALAPVATTAVMSLTNASIALVTVGAWSAAVTWDFVRRVPPPAAGSDGAPVRTKARELFGNRARLALVLAFALIIASFAAQSIAVIALADARGSTMLAGWLLAIGALASVAGGFVDGAASWTRAPHASRRAAMIGAGMTLCAVSAGSPWLLGLAVAAAGSAAAPTFASVYERLGALTPAGSRTEIFGWMLSAGMVGNAAGSALAGAVSDHLGVSQAFAIAAVCAGCASAVLLGVPPSLPAMNRARRTERTTA